MRTWIALVLGVALVGCREAKSPPPAPQEIRVVTFNTHYFGDHDAHHPDGEDAPRVLADLVRLAGEFSPDLWLFQEVYRSRIPNPNPYPTDHVARMREVLPGHEAVFFAYEEGRFAKGVALLWDARKFEAVGAPFAHRFTVTGYDSTKGFVAQVLRRRSDSREFLVASVHLAATGFAGPREAQARELVTLLGQDLRASAGGLTRNPSEIPWILGGDFNTVWRTAEGAYRYLVGEAGMTPVTGSTVMTHVSGLHLDHVFARGTRILEGSVRHDLSSSDHFPVLARLSYP